MALTISYENFINNWVDEIVVMSKMNVHVVDINRPERCKSK